MKIAQLSTPFIPVPPVGYGGIELVVYNLTEGLVKKGHAVTLFAPGSSQTSANLISPFPQELNPQNSAKLFSSLSKQLLWMHGLPFLYHVSQVYEQAKKFDIIHNHFHYLGLFFANFVKTPTVHTYHGDLSCAVESPIERMILDKYKNANWIAISESQKKNCPISLNYVGVIHHGVEIEKFDYQEMGEDYLVWLGRITPKKGLTEAIDVAKQTKRKLMIAGIVHPRDQDFFQKEIAGRIDQKLIFLLGGLHFNEKVKLYRNAKALLYPVSWEEPFGLVMIEAMATGTPVIGFSRGAVTEIIKDGETGYLINHTDSAINGDWTIKKTGVDGLTEAVEKIYSLPQDKYREMRRNARSHVEKNFTVNIMVKKYEEIYNKVLLI